MTMSMSVAVRVRVSSSKVFVSVASGMHWASLAVEGHTKRARQATSTLRNPEEAWIISRWPCQAVPMAGFKASLLSSLFKFL